MPAAAQLSATLWCHTPQGNTTSCGVPSVPLLLQWGWYEPSGQVLQPDVTHVAHHVHAVYACSRRWSNKGLATTIPMLCSAVRGLQVGGSLPGGGLADPDRAPEPPKVKFGEDNPAPQSKSSE